MILGQRSHQMGQNRNRRLAVWAFGKSICHTFPAMTCEQAEHFGYNLDQGICGDFLPTAAIAHWQAVSST